MGLTTLSSFGTSVSLSRNNSSHDLHNFLSRNTSVAATLHSSHGYGDVLRSIGDNKLTLPSKVLLTFLVFTTYQTSGPVRGVFTTESPCRDFVLRSGKQRGISSIGGLLGVC